MHEDQVQLDDLRARIREAGSLLVAFSGGVDSTFLAAVAQEVLGERAAALTAASRALPARGLDEARRLAGRIGIRHLVVESREIEDPRYASNPRDRCYFCKSELYGLCDRAARDLGMACVADGFTVDDEGDWRPGHRAAGERGVRSLLREAGMGKAAVRRLSRDVYDLPTWDRPATPCLASRFPYGTPLTDARLRQVEAMEDALHDLGFPEVRARFHEGMVRIEAPAADLARLVSGGTRDAVVAAARAAGFKLVTLDLEPFRSGRLNDL